MKKQEVIDAINIVRKFNSETNRIEVKSAKDGFPRRCYDTISSFSNKYGGIIIFGINENEGYKAEDVYDINDLQKQISSLCNDIMEPAVRSDFLPMEFEGKKILAVKIDELQQNKKPCYYKLKGLKSGSYTRDGERDDLMTDYEIYALQSYNDHVFEDIRPTKKSTVDDLKEDELLDYIEKLKFNKPNFASNSYEKNLKLCGIVDKRGSNIYPTLAGSLIFGKYPQSFYPQLFIACTVIPGTEIGNVGKYGERFIDNKRVEGTLEEMLDETMKFLRRNMKTHIIFDSSGNRIDRPEYPLEALREAVANALIHRNYSFQTENAFISVYMYSDRIEILNPGALYGKNKIEKLGTATVMESRNPTIVKILEDKGSVIENRHSGIPTMKREMAKYNLPEPEFYEERGNFKVVFRNKKISNYGVLSSQDIQELDSGSQSGAESTDSGSQSTDNINILNKLKVFCNTPRTAVEIKQFLGIKSKRYVLEKVIKPLIENNILEYTNKKRVNARNQKYLFINFKK